MYQGFDRGNSLFQKLWTHLDNREKHGLKSTNYFFLQGGRLRIPDVAIEDGGRYICSQGGRTQVARLLNILMTQKAFVCHLA